MTGNERNHSSYLRPQTCMFLRGCCIHRSQIYTLLCFTYGSETCKYIFMNRFTERWPSQDRQISFLKSAVGRSAWGWPQIKAQIRTIINVAASCSVFLCYPTSPSASNADQTPQFPPISAKNTGRAFGVWSQTSEVVELPLKKRRSGSGVERATPSPAQTHYTWLISV